MFRYDHFFHIGVYSYPWASLFWTLFPCCHDAVSVVITKCVNGNYEQFHTMISIIFDLKQFEPIFL